MVYKSSSRPPSLIWILAAAVIIGAIGLRAAVRAAVSHGLLAGKSRRVFVAPEGPELQTFRLAGIKITLWKPPQPGPYPLVVFSHGFHGSSTQSKFLMMDLAVHGYLVVAPNHKDAGFGGQPEEEFGKADAWSDATYRDRAQDIQKVLAALKADPAWNSQIDWTKIALAGHSLGGYTVLGLAGAWPSWKMPGVKAILALSPYCTPYTSKKTLQGVSIPVMYQGGTRDFGITPFVKRSGGAYDQTPSPAYFIEFEGAGHLAWTDLNRRYQTEISAYSIAFLDKYVKGMPGVGLTEKVADVSDLRSK